MIPFSRVYFGIVEDRHDPLKLGRCKVRVAGLHTHELSILPTSDLPWASVIIGVGGDVGNIKIKEGDQVAVVFSDADCQLPLILGVVPSIPQKKSVWIDQVPSQPLIADAVAPTGRPLPKSNAQNALDNNTLIDNNDHSDEHLTTEIVNLASKNAKDSIELVGDSGRLPTSSGTSLFAANLQQQVGQPHNPPSQRLLNCQLAVGDSRKGLAAFSILESISPNGNQIASALGGLTTTFDKIGHNLSNQLRDLEKAVGFSSMSAVIEEGVINVDTMKKVGAKFGNTSNWSDTLSNALSSGGNVLESIKRLSDPTNFSDPINHLGRNIADSLIDENSLSGKLIGGADKLLNGDNVGSELLGMVGFDPLSGDNKISQTINFGVGIGSNYAMNKLRSKVLQKAKGKVSNTVISNILNGQSISGALHDLGGQLGTEMIRRSGYSGLSDKVGQLLNNPRLGSELISGKIFNSDLVKAGSAALGAAMNFANTNDSSNKVFSGLTIASNALSAISSVSPSFQKALNGTTSMMAKYGVDDKVVNSVITNVAGAIVNPTSNMTDRARTLYEKGITVQNMIDEFDNCRSKFNQACFVYYKTTFRLVIERDKAKYPPIDVFNSVRDKLWENIRGEMYNAFTIAANSNCKDPVVDQSFAKLSGLAWNAFKKFDDNIKKTNDFDLITIYSIGYTTFFDRIAERHGVNQQRTVGVDPQQTIAMINSGSYNDVIMGDLGNRSTIDKFGVENITPSSFTNIGEGRTPPINGLWGGPNFSGGYPQQKKAVAPSNQTISDNKKLNLTCPPNIDLPINVSVNDVNNNIKLLVEAARSHSLIGSEQLATFLACCFAISRCVASTRSYEITSIAELRTRFPRVFDNVPQKIAETFLFAKSMNKQSENDFYDFVDSSSSNPSLGNIEIHDGSRFRECGIIRIRGRRSHSRYDELAKKLTGKENCDSDLIIDNPKLACEIAINEFLLRMDKVGGGGENYFYEMVNRFALQNEQRNDAIIAYQHFYQTNLFGSFRTTEKHAGSEIIPNNYYGSDFNGIPNCGFQDPSGKYPLSRNNLSSALPKLAQGDPRNSIVQLKENQRRTSIKIANSELVWSEPHSGFAAQYPYNHVKETESGHIEEWDDTPGHERIHRWHRSGSFEEIIENGTTTRKIVGDGYTIIDRNGYVSISGDANVTVSGNINILCQSDANIQSYGSTTINAHNNLNIGVGNDCNISCGGNFNVDAKKGINLQSEKNATLRSNQDLYIASMRETHQYSRANYYNTCDRETSIIAKNNVLINSESADVDIKGNNNLSIEAVNQSMHIHSKVQTRISTDGELHTFSGKDTRYHVGHDLIGDVNNDSNVIIGRNKQTIIGDSQTTNIGNNLTNVVANKAKHQSGTFDQSVSGDSNISVGNINIGSRGVANINASGNIGFDGKMIGLNSGFSKAVSISDSKKLEHYHTPCSDFALSCRNGARSEVAIRYGMIPPCIMSAHYPNIEPYINENPLLNIDNAISDDVDLTNNADFRYISNLSVNNNYDSNNTIYDNNGIALINPLSDKNMIIGGKTSVSFNGDPNYIDSEYRDIAHSKPYNANTRVSDHFVLGDFFDGGFNNRNVLQDQVGLTKREIVDNIIDTATNIVEKVAPLMPGGINGYKSDWRINSGFRSVKNNSNSSGSKTSQHLKGQAVDIQLAVDVSKSKKAHYELIQKIAQQINHDQCILEYSGNGRTAWIHISYDKNRNRNMNFTMSYVGNARVIDRSKFVLLA